MKAQVITPTAEELSRLFCARERQDAAELLQKLGVAEDTECIQVNVQETVGDWISQYAHNDKFVMCIAPHDYGTVIMKEAHPKLFEF
jgi:RPA family protein